MRGFASTTATILFATMVVAGSNPGQAAYPERPVTVIVPWPAGGSTDILGYPIVFDGPFLVTQVAEQRAAIERLGLAKKAD